MGNEMAPRKTCARCRAEKSSADFSRHSRYKDGLQRECKACVAVRYLADKDRIRARQRETWAPYAAANREALREKSRQYRTTTRTEQATYRAEYKVQFAPKIAAKDAVWSAVLTGKLLKQPCEVCGAKRADAHHDDYAAPMAVRWLCRPHHAAWHAKHGEAPNGRAIEAKVRGTGSAGGAT